MSDAELTLKIGGVEFHGRGPQDWLAEQLRYAVELSQTSRPISPVMNEGIQEAAQEDRAEEDMAGNRSTRWMKQFGLSEQHLDQVFYRGGHGLEIIVKEASGKSYREKVINSYLLMGTRALLATGDPAFEDGDARSFCKNMGCFDPKKTWGVSEKCGK